MNLFERISEYDHERVVLCNDSETGLRAIIAIHDLTLGPALGGIRMLPYESDDAALIDALRLARGMTYKAAVSGCDLGGGKSVVIGDPRTQKTEELLRAMGRFIDDLGGHYIAGQDIGTGADDLAVVRQETRYLACVHESAGGAGDPSFATAYGVVAGIRAVLEAATGSSDLAGRRVAIQGVGHVGYRVAEHCHEGGASIVVSDLSQAAAERAAAIFGAEVTDPECIYDQECDVFSPCSVGAVVDDDTLDRFRCAAIAGAANNVLAEPRHGDLLRERGIVYGPDYLVNSGGLIRCQEEVRAGGPVDDTKVLDKVALIYDQTLEVIRAAEAESIGTAEAADRIAERRIDEARRTGKTWDRRTRRAAWATAG